MKPSLRHQAMASRRLLAEKTWQSEFQGDMHCTLSDAESESNFFLLLVFLGLGRMRRNMKDLEGAIEIRNNQNILYKM